MVDRFIARLYEPTQAHGALRQAWEQYVKPLLSRKGAPPMVLEVRPQTRSDAQNRLMWSVLTDLSRQVEWCGKRLTKEGWKDFITAHLNGQELIPNMHGTGFISINMGKSTSQMTKSELSAVIELAHAFGSERGINWSKTSVGMNDGCY